MSVLKSGRENFSIPCWDKKSSVRSRSNEYVVPPNWQELLPFRDWYPIAMLPILQHHALSTLSFSDINYVLAAHLVDFLDYTTLLEHKIVNRSLEVIIHHGLKLSVPDSMKKAALQIYTDEGYHALFSDQLAEQVAQLYDLTRFSKKPSRLEDLDRLIQQCPPEFEKLLYFVIGFVSETIIAKELASVTKKHIMPGVFEMFRDHLIDEAQHSRFFSNAFIYVWQHSGLNERRFIANQLPIVMAVFFKADQEYYLSLFEKIGVPNEVIRHACLDLGVGSIDISRLSVGADATLNAMQNAGFFEDLSIDVFLFLNGLPNA